MTATTAAADFVRGVRNELMTDGWCQHSSFDSDGSMCLEGAISRTGTRLASGMPTYVAARSAIVQAIIEADLDAGVETDIHRVSVALWNDTPDRTFTELVDMLDRAEKFAEREVLVSA